MSDSQHPDFITVVSGLPRSGTSLMMQMLSSGGIPPLTDNVRLADESNPRGYFEFEPVKRLRANQRWLEQARGHAVKIIHLLVRELPVDGRFQYRLILMKRPIAAVLASQRAMLEKQGKTSADEAALARIYEAQLLQLEQWLRNEPCFAHLSINYGDVIEHPRSASEQIEQFLRRGLDTDAMAAAVDPQLRHQIFD